MFDPIRWLDWLAGQYIRIRTDYQVKHDPNMQEMKLLKVELEDGSIKGTYISPVIADLADEATSMLDRNSSENYMCFEMMPRVDRRKPPVLVTVQWKDGKSPAQVRDEVLIELRLLRRQHNLVMVALENMIGAVTNANGHAWLVVAARNALKEAGYPFLAENILDGQAASMLDLAEIADIEDAAEDDEITSWLE